MTFDEFEKDFLSSEENEGNGESVTDLARTIVSADLQILREYHEKILLPLLKQNSTY